jgi:hypothetical protein
MADKYIVFHGVYLYGQDTENIGEYDIIYASTR